MLLMSPNFGLKWHMSSKTPFSEEAEHGAASFLSKSLDKLPKGPVFHLCGASLIHSSTRTCNGAIRISWSLRRPLLSLPSCGDGSLPSTVAGHQPPRCAMRLWLLCSFVAAVALVATAEADHGNSKKVARGREGTSIGGRRRPHRPCSGCFSVLSEESRSMSWHTGEDDEVQPGKREGAGREDKDPARPLRPPRSVLLPRQEALSVRTARRGGNGGSGRPWDVPWGPHAPSQL